MFRYLSTILAIWSGTVCFSQTQIIDNLKIRLDSYESKDSVRVNLLNKLSYQYNGNNFQEALRYAKLASALSDSLNYPRGSATAHNSLAYCYLILGDNDLAIEMALKALVISEKYNYYDQLAETYRLLGSIYTQLRETDRSAQFYIKAEKLSLQTKNWSTLCGTYIGIANMLNHKKNEKIDSALNLLNKSLLLGKKYQLTFQLPVIYNYLAHYYSIAHPSETSKVLVMIQKGLNLSVEVNNRYAQSIALQNLGRFYSNQDNFRQADYYFQYALNIAREMGVKALERNLYWNLIELSVVKKDFKSSHEYLIKYFMLKDSIATEKKARQIIELEKKYEGEKKEQTIELLRQEKKIQTIWKNIAVSGSIMLSLFVFIIYRLQRAKNIKAKELITLQKSLNVKLKETDQLKSQFFANISHEFRTPLSLIIAPIEEKLGETNLSTNDKITFRLIKRSASRLLDLVNQLLDLSKIEVGKMQLKIQQGDLHEFISTIAASFESLGANKKINFSVSLDIKPQLVWFDQDKLEKIISNLLFNAFKFTEGGGSVDLKVSIENENSDLKIKINDTGTGIPKADLPHIFSPFYQSKQIVDGDTPGTGLGLSLVYEFIKLYGGAIHIESEENVGTSIFVTIPIRKEKFTDAIILEEQSKASLQLKSKSITEGVEDLDTDIEEQYEESVLIVEDNADLRHYISSSLSNEFTVFLAENGEDGFESAIANMPDIIISDVMMPKMNGIELTNKVKADERTSHIPLVLLTAKSNLDARLEGLEMGADDYMVKPFSTEELIMRVNNLVTQRKKLAAKFGSSTPLPVVKNKETNEPTLDEKFIQKANSTIERHLSESSFGVEKMAAEMNLSRAQLFRKLKAVTGKSPNELINDIRLQRAAELINSKADTLSQICYTVGYNDQSYFSKRFRRKFGKSPSEYSSGSLT